MFELNWFNLFAWLDSKLQYDINSHSLIVRIFLKIFLSILALCIFLSWSIFSRIRAVVKNFSKKTVHTHVSTTSLFVTMIRYQLFLSGRGSDYLSGSMLTRNFFFPLLAWRLYSFANNNYQISYTMAARSNFGDKHLLQARANKFKQIVILGAGNDTRFYRYPINQAQPQTEKGTKAGTDKLNGSGLGLGLGSWLGVEVLGSVSEKIGLFEVDAEATQRYKKFVLSKINMNHSKIDKSNKLVDNSEVEYISVDFGSSLSFVDQMVQKSNFNPKAKTLFLWEGVTYYLSYQAIQQTLQLIGSFPSGSEVIFDYCNDINPSSLASINKVLGKIGEPWLSTFHIDSLKNLLDKSNLNLIESIQATKYTMENPEFYLSFDKNKSLNNPKFFPVTSASSELLFIKEKDPTKGIYLARAVVN